MNEIQNLGWLLSSGADVVVLALFYILYRYDGRLQKLEKAIAEITRKLQYIE